MIEIKNVSKAYSGTTVVDNISCTIQSGGITSIIGPNGAGKSTLLSMIARLIPMDAGSISIASHDVSSTASRTLATIVGTLRQENFVTLRITVRDLVSFGRFPHHGGRPGPADHQKIEEALEYMELLQLQERYLDELSGGQRQRAFVAMVLAQDTDYILLDEPLNNLDMKHSVEMMRRLKRMAHDFGKTIVLVIHDINFASTYSDHIVAMREGNIIQHSSAAEVMKPEILRSIYDIDVDVHNIAGKNIGVYF